MTVHHLETADVFKEANEKHRTVLIDFYATWCGPCKVIAPVIAKLASTPKYKTTIFFAKIDVDQLSDLSDELDVQAMPTLLLFRDGQKVEVLVDPDPRSLVGLLDKSIGSVVEE